MIIHSPVGINAKAVCHSNGIYIGTKEQKFPAKFGFFPFNHVMHLAIAVFTAGIFHAVGSDDKQYFICTVLRCGMLLDIGNFPDGASNGIQQGSTAPDIIFMFRNRCHGVDIQPVMQQFIFIIKQNGGNPDISRFLFLFFQHGIVSADGILLQTSHGAAAVEQENKLCLIGFHMGFLHSFAFFFVNTGYHIKPEERSLWKRQNNTIERNTLMPPVFSVQRRTTPDWFHQYHKSVLW